MMTLQGGLIGIVCGGQPYTVRSTDANVLRAILDYVTGVISPANFIDFMSAINADHMTLALQLTKACGLGA